MTLSDYLRRELEISTARLTHDELRARLQAMPPANVRENTCSGSARRTRFPLIVVDASALLALLLRTPRAEALEERLPAKGESLHAPALIDLEVLQVLRRYEARRELSAQRAGESLDLLRV